MANARQIGVGVGAGLVGVGGWIGSEHAIQRGAIDETTGRRIQAVSAILPMAGVSLALVENFRSNRDETVQTAFLGMAAGTSALLALGGFSMLVSGALPERTPAALAPSVAVV